MHETGRRQFLAGLFAASLVPRPTWADAGSPAYLSAARRPDGSFVLCGLRGDLELLFQFPLPDRGHAAAAHPFRPEAVAFARRPGTFAMVIDCKTGARKVRLSSPSGRHFYGHGCFSADGSWLFTTENDFEVGRGLIGVWDVSRGYVRIDEVESGGIGPHDIKRLPGTDTLVVANGGIDTHPDSGRAALNISEMKPSLSYVEDGSVVETVSLPRKWHKNSIRHLAASSSGQVAFGMQWQGARQSVPMAGVHERGQRVQIFNASSEELQDLQGYIGSIAFTQDETNIVVTSPRGNATQIYDVETGNLVADHRLTDASGVAPSPKGVLVTSGTGEIMEITGKSAKTASRSDLVWDNHLIAI